jgi:hypothetical protein
MNRTREIERPEWSGFLDGFSRQHEGWLVTVEQVSTPAGPSAVEARELPLESVSADPDGTISISVGRTAERHLTHIVPRAARLLVEESDEGVDRGIRIERNYGPSTRVLFRSAVRPEEVDGIPAAGNGVRPCRVSASTRTGFVRRSRAACWAPAITCATEGAKMWVGHRFLGDWNVSV